MAYIKDLQLPRMGEAMDAARVSHWHVSPGETFSKGDVLLEIETDKSVIEVPATEDGKLVEQLIGADELIDADAPVGRIEVEGEAPPEESDAPAAAAPAPAPATLAADAPTTTTAMAAQPGAPAAPQTAAPDSDRKFATPVARQIARTNGLDITAITGSGPHGRVTKADVTAALATRGGAQQPDSGGRVGGRASVDDRDIATAHGELHIRTWTPPGASDAATLVLIHGLFGDLDTWAGTASAANRLGLRVMAMDLPCHGSSRSAVTRFTDIIEAVAEAIAGQCPGPIALVGHSFGAAVAARVARKPDLDIASLTLFAPVGLGTEIEQSFLNGMVNAGSIASLEREMGKLTVAGATPSGAYLKTLRERLEQQAAPLAALCREVSWNGVQQLDISADLQALECPITLVCGRSDAIIPWQHALNAPPRAALHIAPGVGHMPQWEATALTGEIIARAAGYR
ncbi:MAG: alpha/beta fold hydrolase [Aquisalimonadaceae bacterium]